MEPSDSGETFWMLLSLLVLPVEEQVRVIGGLPETASKIEGPKYYGDPYVFPEDLKDNNAISLLSMLATYSSGWLDEFDPDCPNARRIDEMAGGGKVIFGYSLGDFKNKDEWKLLRSLAKDSLKEVELDIWEVPDRIEFEKYLEIVR